MTRQREDDRGRRDGERHRNSDGKGGGRLRERLRERGMGKRASELTRQVSQTHVKLWFPSTPRPRGWHPWEQEARARPVSLQNNHTHMHAEEKNISAYQLLSLQGWEERGRPVMYVEQLVSLVTVLIQHISIDNYYYYYITISVLVREFKGENLKNLKTILTHLRRSSVCGMSRHLCLIKIRLVQISNDFFSFCLFSKSVERLLVN